jgi:hypothetical protein
MTKMMTVYLVYEAIADGRIGFDTIVPISQYAYEFSRRQGETNVPLSRSVRYTVDELLDVAIVMSAGGATVALAELVGGSMNAFYRIMNNKAAQWGIDATFFSSSGGSTHTRMTPRAMAVITRNSVLHYPEILEKTAMRSVTFRGRTIPSTNHLLGVYQGIDGFKTGTNSVARECFSATAQRGDVRLVSVVMGSSSGRRFSDTTTLLNHGFATVEARRQAEIEAMEAMKVSPTSSTVFVDGVAIDFEAFHIRGSNYFKIRDLAYALSGTAAQFNVEWDRENSVVVLTSGVPYTVVGGEMAGRGDERKLPVPTSSRIILDGAEVIFTAYNIDGNNFLRLRDVGEAFGFGVIWDEAHRAIFIDTSMGYIP